MNAIIPLHVTALRVNITDASLVVNNFKGRTACFDQLPYRAGAKDSSTGDRIVQPLESKNSPSEPLKAGVHLHWELPDYFKNGSQCTETGKVRFPQVPNRWLVMRYLNKYDPATQNWLSPVSRCWIVESDYISETLPVDTDGKYRAAVPVPLPVSVESGNQPYRYMGRVVEGSGWQPADPDALYLKDFPDAGGTPYSLNAPGFLGPGFSSYYPDCCSVFGFHDRFTDEPDLYDAIHAGKPVQFKVSYQVIGWIEGEDPCGALREIVATEYKAYVDECKQRETEILKTPADLFFEYARKNLGWEFNAGSISYELDEEQYIKEFRLPEKTLCNGILQNIVWDMLTTPGTKSFLSNPESADNPSVWKTNDLRLSIGNNSDEALAALLSADVCMQEKDNALERQYEQLLRILQSGELEHIDSGVNILSRLEKELTGSNFAYEQGGLQWVIREKTKKDTVAGVSEKRSIPFSLTASLDLLNQAQKVYDTSREALETERKQFFMDWYKYVKKYCTHPKQDDVVSLNDLSDFIQNSLAYLVKRGKETGVLSYQGNGESGIINKVVLLTGTDSSYAWQVRHSFCSCVNEIREYEGLELLAIPDTVYSLPADPVLAMEVNGLCCKLRNGDRERLPVRTTPEIPDRIEFRTNGFQAFVEAKEICTMPCPEIPAPFREGILRLLEESSLLLPIWAGRISTILENKGGTNNPAVNNKEQFEKTFCSLLGGNSRLEGNCTNGLFEWVRSESYEAERNPSQRIEAPMDLTVLFSNKEAGGWLPDALGWNVQECFTELNENRYDPFLPVSLVWEASQELITRKGKKGEYSPDNLTGYFTFNPEGTDYIYNPDTCFTEGLRPTYTGSSLLMKKSIQSVTGRLEKYRRKSECLAEKEKVDKQIEAFRNRSIITLTLSGFHANTVLRTYLPKMELLNLPYKTDVLTRDIRNVLAEAAKDGDNWYDTGFNAEAPLSAGTSAKAGFCPLRSGFLSIRSLEVVDVFGQRMQLFTPQLQEDRSLSAGAAASLSPLENDKKNQGKAYLPPRILTPTRLSFEWTRAYKSTSAVCGWIVPDYLTPALFFYDSDGSAIGSLGKEHDALVYRTRPGNRNNPGDSLEEDIGTVQEPKTDPWLAHFMRYIVKKSAGSDLFLTGLINVILDSENYTGLGREVENGSLSVLTGRPLALARSTLRLETYGCLPPLNPCSMSKADPWPQDINENRYIYSERLSFSDGGLRQVEFPVRLGNISGVADGLIGYLFENEHNESPYGNGDFYSPVEEGNGVVLSQDTTVRLTVNQDPLRLTMLVDPRVSLHAYTGILPITSLSIPPEDFAEITQRLQLTFFTHPLLQQKFHFSIPLPGQRGYTWSWVTTHSEENILVAQNFSSGDVSWGYSPQTLEEGWLKLEVDPDKNNP